jgi:hypothetical protein
MTLRELLKEVSYKEVFNLIYKNFLKPQKLSRAKVMDEDIEYHALFMCLRNLSYTEPGANKIYITYINEGIDVCLFDEEKDEIFALDSMGYKYIIDMEIYKAIDIGQAETLAHILRAIN